MRKQTQSYPTEYEAKSLREYRRKQGQNFVHTIFGAYCAVGFGIIAIISVTGFLMFGDYVRALWLGLGAGGLLRFTESLCGKES
jgi:hypothetical protein